MSYLIQEWQRNHWGLMRGGERGYYLTPNLDREMPITKANKRAAKIWNKALEK